MFLMEPGEFPCRGFGGSPESSMVSGEIVLFFLNLNKCDHPTPVCAEGNVCLSFIIVKILVKHLFFGNIEILQRLFHESCNIFGKLP